MPVKNYKKQIILVIIILILLIAIGLGYMTYMLNKIEANTYNSINTVVQNDTKNLKTEIINQKAILQSITSYISSVNKVEEEKIFDMYEKSDITSQFIRMAIMTQDGKTITNDGFKVDYSDEVKDFFRDNEIKIFDNKISRIDGEKINIYSQAVNVKDEKVAILLIISTESYKNIFVNNIFESKGFSYIVDNTGNIIVSANIDRGTGTLINNIDNMLVGNSKEKFEKNQNVIESNIENGIAGERILQTSYGKTYMVYEPIGVNGWALVYFIPSSAISGEINQALLLTFIVSIVVILIALIVCIYIVISNNKKQIKLYEYAYIDPVTKKGNIYYLRKYGQEELEKDKKNLYLAILDVNKFKMINKAYGYKVGDEILFGIGVKLREILGDNSIICRYSNDYFSMIFRYENDINALINTIISNIEKLKINDEVYDLSVNLGLYKVQEDDNNISVIMDKAIIAHSLSKGNVFDKFYIYDEKVEKKIEFESKIEQNMETALRKKEFKIYYQPKFNTKEESLYGAEALVRWYHDGEIITPDKFIPLFEKNRFILKLDLYIFEQVCKDLKMWKEKYGKNVVVSINVSRQHFMDEHFLERYLRITTKYGINPNNIDLEITESAAIEEGIDILAIMKRMKEYGFLISIDDFGTGYSSLNMLQDMPIDILKIDKSFVDQIGKSKRNIIDYIINIAKELKLKTIAEGVETKEQRDYLLERKCDIIQGYYYEKPIKEEEFEKYLKD